MCVSPLITLPMNGSDPVPEPTIPRDPVVTEKRPPKRRVKGIMELAKVTSEPFLVEFDMGDTEFEVSMKRISFRQWREIEDSVPVVVPPERVQGKQKRFAYDHPRYRDEQDERMNRIGVLRVAASVVDDVPGKTLEERADFLAENLTIGMVLRMYRWLAEMHGEGESDDVALADTFQ